MSTPQITPNSVLMNPAEVSSHAQTAQILTVARAKDAFQKAEEKAKSDSVNISKEALRMAKDAQGFVNEPEKFERKDKQEDEGQVE